MADTMTLEQVRSNMRDAMNSVLKDDTRRIVVDWYNAIDAAIKQRERDSKDAARYRWLRDTQTTFGVSVQYDTAGKPIFYVRLPGFGTSADNRDAAIDAAMAKESGNG